MFLLIFLLFICCGFGLSVEKTLFDDYPTIHANDGHLTLQVSRNKHIFLKTDGDGSIHINGVDLKNVTQIAASFSNAMTKYKTNFDITLEKIQTIETVLSNNKNNLSSSIATYRGINPQIAIRRLNRRVMVISRKLNALINELNTDECLSAPCKNGGICQDLFNKFHCVCPKEWEGSTCEIDVNECQRLKGTDLGCQNGATCTNKPGSYECSCASGWYGTHCTLRTNDCSSGTELCGHGTCIPQNNDIGYKCLCDQGWKTNGVTPACNTDVNECTDNKPPCSVNPRVLCMNTPGSFVCGYCPIGYTGNGFYCTDIDECKENNGGCSTVPMVQCINTLGSSYCGNCPPGYSGDGKTCSYQGVCNVNNGGCHPLANCTDNSRISSTFVTCTCPPGYAGSGIGPNGCIRSSGPSPCSPNPCRNGQCTVVGTSYVCHCNRYYSGRNCDQDVNACTSNPCQNGGTCVPIFHGMVFRCQCPTQYAGARCETEKQSCGGRLIGESGTLVFPTLLSKYEHGSSCAWLIETNETKVLNITFTKFNVEESPNCQYDWLQIHDGRNTLAQSLGRFCGKQLPKGGVIVSTHNMIYLWFRSDYTIADGGFQLNWTTINASCGESETIMAGYGTLQSPGSPSNYPNNRDCYWTLQAPFNYRIVFHFFTLLIGNNSDCNADYIEFTSGSETFAKFCNSSHPEPIHSPDNKVTVHFHSDSANNYPGFQLTYSTERGIPGCGGIYTAEKGEIRSPQIDGKYPPDLLCEYKIKVRNMYKIKLRFLSFSIEQSKNCMFDSLSIYSGGSISSGLIGRYCGDTLPAPYVSTENEILIVFKSDWATSSEGFVLSYEIVCGGKYTEPSGTISWVSPSSLNSCIFEIIQPVGKIIELTVEELNFVNYGGVYYNQCTGSGLEIRDGDNENSTLIGRYCNKPPPLIISKYNYLWLKFYSSHDNLVLDVDYSDYEPEPKKFKVSYVTKTIGCGGILKDPIGTISSPSSAKQYEALSNCLWIISAPPGYVIQLTFMMFHLEKSQSCAYDYIEIFDNNTDTRFGGSMGKFCGHTTPPLMLSTSNIVTVHFATDATIAADGFLATYNFLQESSVCGGNYYTSAGYIKSPDYPNNYPVNIECTWTITVPPGQQIRLNITDFSLESYSNCRYDWIEIRNGGTSTSPLIGRFCGTTIPKTIPSHTNKLFMQFKSDLTKSERGFKIYWDSITTGCGGVLNAPTGSIISPNYPQFYDPDTECIWKISVSAGSLVQVVFSDLDIEAHEKCLLDYVEFFDGPDVASKSMGRYCSQHPSYLNSTSNHMTVKFRADISQEGRGFQIQYFTLCNVTVHGFGGVIESPNFPNNYPYNLNCNWYIEVDSMNKINITFSHFDIEAHAVYPKNKSEACLFDYVKISELAQTEDLESDSYNTYGIYCGQTVPDLISLNSHKALIHFVTDNLLHGSGFRLEWALNGCGGILTHPTGTISSPNYPRQYPRNIECNWFIQVAYGNSIQLEFIEIDIEKSMACEYDHLKVFNGEDDTYPELTKLCHNVKPVTVSSSGNFMAVKFKVDQSFEGRGFTANYSTIPTKCGGSLTAPSGYIMSPNYPKNHDANDTCGYLIDVDESHTIILKIEDFDLVTPRGVNCSENNSSYVKIYNGPTVAYPVLGKLCGKVAANTTFESTYNHMFVELVTSGTTTSKGFKAKYEKSCGSRIVASGEGTISMSQHEFIGINCSWTIIAENPNKHITLTITTFHTMYGSCEYEPSPLKIYNGESSESPLIGEYCSTKLPPPITSSGPAMHIVADLYQDLFATYSVFDSACGGDLRSLAGSFASPGYPKKYPVDTQCEWNVLIPKGSRVNIRFQEFGLLESEHCNTDYLELRKESSSGSLLGTFCGNTLPMNITTEGSVWVMLKTSYIDGDSDGNKLKGFLADYELEPNTQLFGSKGVVESPLYIVQSYLLGDFTWQITVSPQKRILITFKDMAVGSYMSTECYSSLNIYDGEDDSAPSLGELCGYDIPDPIQSSSNVLFIKTNMLYSSINGKMLFRFEWMEVDSRSALVPLPPKKTNCSSNSIIDLDAIKNYTIIQSPGYPYGYENNLDCEWIVSTVQTKHLKLFFQTMDLEPYYFDKCHSDYVEIFQKRINSDWQSVNKFCRDNSTMNPIETTNLMKIVFHTNRFGNGTGFKAKIREECGGTLTDPSGFIVNNNITRKGMPKLYNQACEWNITVRAGRTIRVNFVHLEIAQDPVKCTNYIMLRNGKFSDSPLLGEGKYCGNTHPTSLTTIGNNLYVKYVGFLASSNFILEYSELSVDCKSKIQLEDFAKTVKINTPNYPNIPSPHTECSWTIMAPPGETIRIDFTGRFDLYTNSDCTKEYVEIRDGGTVLSKLIGRYCSTTPNAQFSTDNMMYVKFFTDLDDPGNGFEAEVSIAKCGGTLHGNTGQLDSPFFNKPEKYPIGYNCTWRFLAPKFYRLKLKFKALDLGISQNCSGDDAITISETNPMDDNTILGRFCGKTIPNEIQASGNEVTIHFTSSKTKQNLKGFSIGFNATLEECGGKLQSSSGIIQSPNYPNSNQMRRSCSWLITVPKGRRITFEFLDYDISHEGELFSNGIAFYNSDMSGFLASSYTSKEPLQKISSADNTLFVYYWEQAKRNQRGFKAKYSSNEPTICKGSFNETSGVISNPTEPIRSYICTYRRDKYTPGTTVAVNIKVSGNVTRPHCSPYWAFVKLYTESDRIPINYFCSTTGAIVRSPFPVTNLKFIGNFRMQLNYTATYETYNCGGKITQDTGTISSPNFPNKYSGSLECTWLIVLPKEQQIKLTITDLKLGDDCDKNFLDVYNGELPTKPKIGRFCHNTIPNIIQSETNNLWIDYRFEKTSNGIGFSLKYEPIVQGCGGHFHDRTRVIQTPAYPTQYPDNVECLWELESPFGYHIGFHFISRIEIEKTTNCTNDFLEVWDWQDDHWVSFGRFCGREIPGFNSTSTKMKVMFRSNDRIVGMGFKARWEWNCGGTFKATNKERFIFSPGYPNIYPKNLYCEYNISASRPGEYVTLRFDDFALEGPKSTCRYDNVTISSIYKPQRHTFWKTYCADSKPPLIRLFGNAYVKFATDGYVNMRGFKFAYQVEGCGGNITTPTEIESGAFNIAKHVLYNGFFQCVWQIHAPPNKIITVHFTFFQMQYRRSCYYDNVEIYDDLKVNRVKQLANLCGDLSYNLPVVQSTKNVMLIKSSIDRTTSQQGFKAVISFNDGPESGCGGDKTLNSSNPLVLTAPNLQELNCVWNLMAPANYYLKIVFDELDLPSTCSNFNQTFTNCSCANLVIRDGILLKDENIETLCGIKTTNFQRSILTSGNRAMIRLHGRFMKNKAFKATITALPTICGSVLLTPTNNVQTIKSPNYPNSYPPNIKCVWTLKSQNKIKIQFIEFDTDRQQNCDGDRLEIIDTEFWGYGQNAGTYIGYRRNYTNFEEYDGVHGIYKFCGTLNHTFDYFSNGISLKLLFKSQNQVKPGKKFLIEYSLATCNRNYTSEQGRIFLQNQAACDVYIKVPEGRTISVYFQRFFMFTTPNCEKLGLEIKDGESANSAIIMKDCGYSLPSPIFSTKNVLHLRTWAIMHRSAAQLDLVYTSTTEGRGCGGTLYNYRGRFKSPLYPNSYKKDKDCKWSVRVPSGLRVAIKFNVFDIQGDCLNNYVEVTTRDDSNDNVATHKFCNNDNPATLYSYEFLNVTYSSTTNNNGRGFLALFEAVH